jgi:hypothetical protein
MTIELVVPDGLNELQTQELCQLGSSADFATGALAGDLIVLTGKTCVVNARKWRPGDDGPILSVVVIDTP